MTQAQPSDSRPSASPSTPVLAEDRRHSALLFAAGLGARSGIDLVRAAETIESYLEGPKKPPPPSASTLTEALSRAASTGARMVEIDSLDVVPTGIRIRASLGGQVVHRTVSFAEIAGSGGYVLEDSIIRVRLELEERRRQSRITKEMVEASGCMAERSPIWPPLRF